MAHIELRDLDDDDLDAVFDMMREPEAVALAAFTAAEPGDRGAFDEWIEAQRHHDGVLYGVVTENGGFAGTAAAFAVGGDREVSFWITKHAWGRGVAAEALRVLISREPERPLYARAAAHNIAAITVLEHNGFTELSRSTTFAPGLARDIEEVVFILMPALDGV